VSLRVSIFTQYFTPEVGATSTRVHSFAEGLARRGHDVEVVCEVPNHPKGVIDPAYRGRVVRRQRIDGFRGSWLWVRTRPEKSTADRLAFYGSYLALAVAWGSLARRPHVVLASSPPLPVALAGALVALRHRAPFVMDVRDLWPEAAVAVGELSDPRALRAAERLEGWLYRRAAAVTAVTEPFVDHIERRGGAGKVTLLPNGTTRFWLDSAGLAPDRARQGLPPERFVWSFAGNLGLAQGLRTAIDAAAILGPGFRLVLLGDGAERRELERHAASVAPGLVEFRDQVPKEGAAALLRASDALLVSLAPDPVLASFVPSKLFDCCATGRPVIVAAAGEPQRLSGASGAALPVPPGDAPALAAAVRRLRDRPGEAAALGERGRAFAAANLREHHAEALERVLLRAARA
jgi:glycosyltransferase involved in cell wall biosynthesis